MHTTKKDVYFASEINNNPLNFIDMANVIITANELAKHLVETIGLKLQRFITEEEEQARFSGYRALFGVEFYDEACQIAMHMTVKVGNDICFRDEDTFEWVLVEYSPDHDKILAKY